MLINMNLPAIRKSCEGVPVLSHCSCLVHLAIVLVALHNLRLAVVFLESRIVDYVFLLKGELWHSDFEDVYCVITKLV